ncbi:putative serine/threonine protein kinase [Trypanosoma vivax]|nr:putative serine/threonine protein kinase [Trypanosoma vivax]
MIQKKVLNMGAECTTILVKDMEAGGSLRVVKKINVSSWKEADIVHAHEVYAAIAESRTAGMLGLKTVTLQGSLMTLVSTFCSGEELRVFIEESVCGPLDEVRVLRWLLCVAKVVQQVHQFPVGNGGACFYGLTPERLFVIDGGREICVGLPIPRALYFKILAEREARGVVLQREYPPEVLRGQLHYTQASDIWQLGYLSMYLLCVNASFTNRSAGVRALTSAMLNPLMRKRPPIEEVVSRLVELIADTSVTGVGTSRGTSSPLSSGGVLTPRRSAPEERIHTESLDEQDTATSAASKSLDPYDCDDTRRRHWRNRLPSSWHTKAMKQFEELQKMKTSPMRSRSRPPSSSVLQETASQPVYRHVKIPENTTEIPWTEFGQRSPSPKELSDNSPSCLGRLSLMTTTTTAISSRPSRSLTADLEQLNAIHAQGHGGNGVLKRRQARLPEACMARADQRSEPRETRQKSYESERDKIRKHIKRWKEQSNFTRDDTVLYSEQDGVTIFLPKNGPPPPTSTPSTPPPGTPTAESVITTTLLSSPPPRHEQTQGPEQYIAGLRNELSCPSMGAAVEPREEEGRRVKSLGSVSTSGQQLQAPHIFNTPPSTTPKRTATTYRQRGISPNVPKTRARLNNPNLSDNTPTSRTTLESSSNVSGGTVTVVARRNGSDFSPVSSILEAGAVGRTFPPSQSNGQENVHQAAAAQGANFTSLQFLERTIGDLAISIRRVVPAQKVYNEVMDVVEVFARRSDSERANPRFNAVFVKTVRDLFIDEDALLSVVPLCAQLVPLKVLLRRLTGRNSDA